MDVLVGLLYLGNVELAHDESETHAVLSGEEHLAKAAELLGIDVDELRKSILMKIVRYPGQVMEIDHTLDEARHAHESLIKSAYAKLFN